MDVGQKYSTLVHDLRRTLLIFPVVECIQQNTFTRALFMGHVPH